MHLIPAQPEIDRLRPRPRGKLRAISSEGWWWLRQRGWLNWHPTCRRWSAQCLNRLESGRRGQPSGITYPRKVSFTRISPPLWPESLFPTRETW